LKRPTREGWLEAHPYLQPVAAVCAEVDRAARDIEIGSAPVPSFAAYDADFRAGVALLRSRAAAVDLAPAGRATVSLAARLAAAPSASSGRIAGEASALAEGLRREPEAAPRVAEWLLGEASLEPPAPGLLRYLGWTVLARYLAPVVAAFEKWRNDELWLRPGCPACGSPPAMAQLVGTDPGRKRLLVCGGCGTRWQFPRTKCPFCGEDAQELSVVTIEGEGGLRLDSCRSCRGYLKTYDGQGQEDLFLADWTSLHLDLVAHDRGLERRAASLFTLDLAAAFDA